jgi:hypothetical protein
MSNFNDDADPGSKQPAEPGSSQHDPHLQPQVSDEELKRRERETTAWYTTPEVLARLEGLQ